MPPDFFAKLDKSVQIVYKIDKKCEKNHSMLNKTFINGMIPEFCKRLSKKCSEHRINKGVQSIFEMHRSVVFFSIFEFIKILYFYVLIHGYFFDF